MNGVGIRWEGRVLCRFFVIMLCVIVRQEGYWWRLLKCCSGSAQGVKVGLCVGLSFEPIIWLTIEKCVVGDFYRWKFQAK